MDTEHLGKSSNARHGRRGTSALTARASTTEADGPRYTIVTRESLDAYRSEIERKARRDGAEFKWLAEYFELWARWHAGELRSGLGGGGGLLPAYNEHNDMPKCTVSDINGTAFDDLMLDIEKAYSKLRKISARHADALYSFYRLNDGPAVAAQKLGVSRSGFYKMLNQAYRHIADLLETR